MGGNLYTIHGLAGAYIGNISKAGQYALAVQVTKTTLNIVFRK